MTKASILEKLLPFSGLKFVIDPFFSFTVEEWTNQAGRIEKKIRELFAYQKVIVRSSAMFEDHHEEISPGEFHSVLNVHAGSRTSIRAAIRRVIDSYSKSHVARDHFLQNQIIVQRQLFNPCRSGVFDSSDWFYYMIEYADNNEATDDVTSGKECKRVELFRHSDLTNTSWVKLVTAATEIEKILGWRSYQLEFAIDSLEQVHIFQAKKIIQKPKPRVSAEAVNNVLTQASAFVNAKQHMYPLLSDMADWNPSEMLGELATPLQISLYQYLVTDRAWSTARQSMGYRDTRGKKLIAVLAGKPYVDISLSFTSFLPANLSAFISKKILDIQFEQLRQHPELHDKVEFEILITCKEMFKPLKTRKLSKSGLSANQLMQFERKLNMLTKEMLTAYDSHYSNDIRTLQKLAAWRQKYLKDKKIIKSNLVKDIEMVLVALQKCRQWGVIPFARQARYAFVAREMFASLSDLATKDEINEFWSSFPTITTELIQHLLGMQEDRFSRKSFFEKFGHLRPSTYDIESKRYDTMSLRKLREVNGMGGRTDRCICKRPDTLASKLDAFLKQGSGMHLKASWLLGFIQQSTQMREYAKFQFSAVLSDTLEIIAAIGKHLGFTRSDMQMITRQDFIVAHKMADIDAIKAHWRDMVKERKRQYKVYQYIRYPSLISSASDFYINQTITAKPNFTTSKIIEGDLTVIGKGFVLGEHDLSGKIVCIPAADPGYDWIFSFDICGLITKYGGAASHMAMRCVQFGIPAAIGCGEVMFDKVCASSKLRIDCKRKNIIFLK